MTSEPRQVLGKSSAGGRCNVTGDEFEFTLYEAARRLLASELYLAHLRRTLKNDWNPKVLTDFLVMDDVCMVARSSPIPVGFTTDLWGIREVVFDRALKSALRLDVRIHDRILKMEKYLRSGRPVGLSADLVIDFVYKN